MNSIKFLKLDFRISKSQNRLLILICLCVIVMSAFIQEPWWGFLYMGFCSVIFSTIPFTMTSQTNNGMIKMLPSATLSRVMGRYLYAVCLTLLGMAGGAVCCIAAYLFNGTRLEVDTFFNYIVIIAMMTVIMQFIQYLSLYIASPFHNQIVIRIINMLPGFILLFGMNSALSAWREAPVEFAVPADDIMGTILSVLAIVTVIVAVLCVFISYVLTKRRDDGY